MSQFADVLLPLYLPGTFTYRIPPTLQNIAVGSRVLVPLGRKKIYTAIVVQTHDIEPKGYEIKEIISQLDDKPILRYPQLKFWDWISNYYMCTVGEVYKAAVPSGLKVESETCISVNPDYEESAPGELDDREKVILDFTSQRETRAD
jgi:primosomal protein N' (replication factor Y)